MDAVPTTPNYGAATC